MNSPVLSWDVLNIDLDAEVAAITERLRTVTASVLHKRGLVVAISGGIDSSVCLALAARAVGPQRVLGLILPERDSSDDSAARAVELAEHLGVRYEKQDIAPALEGIGCYKWRDEAIRSVIADYGPGWRMKIVISGGIEGRVNHFKLIAVSPSGEQREERLGLKEYLQIVAATNFKQRLRKTLEYFHADRLNYAVVGTPNRLEYDQGFFVKGGDGLADLKPIAHLYKTQVYQLASALGVPEGVTNRPPTTDTYSLPQSQEEFYFSLPAKTMDLVLHAYNSGLTAAAAAEALGYEAVQIERVYRDIEQKRAATRYLHLPAQLVEPVPQIRTEGDH